MAPGFPPDAAVHDAVLAIGARDELWAAVARNWPNEVVLLLGGQYVGATAYIERCSELTATATSPHHFRAHAVDFVRLEASLRADGHRWLGFAHSHPDGDAALSTTDRAELWRGCVQLVVGTRGPQATAAAAFWLWGQQLQQLPLRVAAAAEARA